MLYQCPDCNWQGSEPSIAEYPDTDEGMEGWAEDLGNFRYELEHHDCSYILDREAN